MSRILRRRRARLHADRIARRDRHHRRPDRPAPAPPVQAAREAAAGRAQCTNNLKAAQAWAAASYHDQQGTYPGGSYSGTLFNPPHVGTYPENFSAFVRMLPQFEQSSIYNATNFNLCSADPANITICGVQISSLICPSGYHELADADPAPRRGRHQRHDGLLLQQYRRPPGDLDPGLLQLRGERRDVHVRVLEPDVVRPSSSSSTA